MFLIIAFEMRMMAARSGFLLTQNVAVLFRPLHISSVLGSKSHSAGASKGTSKGPVASGTPSATVVNVPGLSKKVCDVPNSEVGPGASKSTQYKNPEYFCYNQGSYFEAEVEMLKYRCPQPSSKAPLVK